MDMKEEADFLDVCSEKERDTKELVKKVKIEAITSRIDVKSELEEDSTCCSQNEEYNLMRFNETIKESEIETKIDIKEEQWWLEREDSCVSDDIKEELAPTVQRLQRLFSSSSYQDLLRTFQIQQVDSLLDFEDASTIIWPSSSSSSSSSATYFSGAPDNEQQDLNQRLDRLRTQLREYPVPGSRLPTTISIASFGASRRRGNRRRAGSNFPPKSPSLPSELLDHEEAVEKETSIDFFHQLLWFFFFKSASPPSSTTTQHHLTNAEPTLESATATTTATRSPSSS